MTTALVVGSGPNGLSAAITLARAGITVTVVESATTVGGGLRSGEQTLPGLLHDHCAAIVPTAVSSPFMKSLDLESHGVRWAWPDIDLAHPLDGGAAGVLYRSLPQTAEGLGADGRRWSALFGPLARNYDELANDLLSPVLKVPHRPVRLAMFGLPAMMPATAMARWFRTRQARALFAGNAAHAWVPLSRPPTAAFAMMFGAIAHRYGWPCVVGGTARLADGLAGILRSLGGRIEIGVDVCELSQLTGYDMVFFDTGPGLPSKLLGARLPVRVRRALGRQRYGPAAYKLDLAVHEGVPWANPEARRAGTVHVCGSERDVVAAERATARGQLPERPFVIVAQQALMDPGRATGGLVPIYAYAHVPHGFTGDATPAILRQVERFAPGFRDRIAAVAEHRPRDLQRVNPNNVGGDINGGSMDIRAFFARPRLAVDPYWLGVDSYYLCSASTPPGGGVHGMCGHLAARAALRRLGRNA
ncbi:NAD(P)/FAD-dependent oxidoreductase [Mycobacterium sp. TY814]|uniref:phytoene desaturase family protein n=1 Tax=unclassified Mycobacterium TaxID=2642494 RepID=UPI000FAFFFB4|nr:NAD(P)/FAD-dependent oxidoreductase [Mycobacterium sp. TY814]MDP7722468.1 NAD(P)/FAD-dependent oxidoreductase [Mycobacterium sp. TY814]RUP03792.1 MAG: NAD(P)/FAD-dependent oxidoreductase [Mycobacterium sp.]